jgi:hypothetical protein
MLRLIAVVLSACSLIACSSQSPVAPAAFGASDSSLDAKPSSGVPGVYALSFWVRVGNVNQEASSLPVLTGELILKAQVTDTSGNPATLGSVTFDYCSYNGRPNDITQADHAPKEACEQGLAKWTRLDSIYFSSSCQFFGGGTSCLGFGTCRTPRTIGFRFRYAQKNGTIAGGTSEARNFVWVAQS